MRRSRRENYRDDSVINIIVTILINLRVTLVNVQFYAAEIENYFANEIVKNNGTSSMMGILSKLKIGEEYYLVEKLAF